MGICLNILETGSLQKETMKSQTVPLEGFHSSPLWHWVHCRRQSCNRMATRREKDNFPFTPEFSDGHVLLYSSSLIPRSYVRVLYYTCKNIWKAEIERSSLNSCIDCVLFCFLNLCTTRSYFQLTETSLFGWAQQIFEAHLPENSHSWLLHLWESNDWQPI